MEQTSLQYAIELSVTRGIGYNFETDFSTKESYGLLPSQVRNTVKGLRAHLMDLGLGGEDGFKHDEVQKMIDKAYRAKARRRKISSIMKSFGGNSFLSDHMMSEILNRR